MHPPNHDEDANWINGNQRALGRINESQGKKDLNVNIMATPATFQTDNVCNKVRLVAGMSVAVNNSSTHLQTGLGLWTSGRPQHLAEHALTLSRHDMKTPNLIYN
jgi:hypothetical protein